MSKLNNKIDFAIVFTVRNANPNGDPIDDNRPRTTSEGLGEVSDVCLKRKIRNRLLDNGYNIFVQSDDKKIDDSRSLKDRADKNEKLKKCSEDIKKNKAVKDDYAKIACETWYDVRAFGQVFAFSANNNKKKKNNDSENNSDKDSDAVSIGVRGPVSIQPAFSLESVNVISSQITKSVNGDNSDNPNKKSSDTMGMKHRVEYGVYVSYGAINVQLAEKTGFSEEDAEALKEALLTLFVNDETSARPAGSMEVINLVWWKHNCPNGQYSSAKVHRTLDVNPKTGEVSFNTKLEGLTPEVISGE